MSKVLFLCEDWGIRTNHCKDVVLGSGRIKWCMPINYNLASRDYNFSTSSKLSQELFGKSNLTFQGLSISPENSEILTFCFQIFLERAVQLFVIWPHIPAVCYVSREAVTPLDERVVSFYIGIYFCYKFLFICECLYDSNSYQTLGSIITKL